MPNPRAGLTCSSCTAVRLVGREGPKLVLEVDHVETKVSNELMVLPPVQLKLCEKKRCSNASCGPSKPCRPRSGPCGSCVTWTPPLGTAEVRSACRPIPPAGPRVSFQRRGAEGVGEPAAPDHHALVAVKGDTVRDLVVLVALVGSEPTEIDEVIVKGGTWGVGADR